jgi:hypothetical protein
MSAGNKGLGPLHGWSQHGDDWRRKRAENPSDYEGYSNALPGAGYARPATLNAENVRQIIREELERALRGKR